MADPTGLAVVVVDNDAVLTWAGSPTPYVADYSVFRRSPATGAVFNPAGTPIASGITSLTYADNDLPTGSYDWQVFGRVVIPTVAPTITSPSSTSFTQGTAGTFTVTATGTPTPTLSMTGTLPAGVTFVAGTGVLAGTPTASGTFPLVFTAANGTLPNAVQNFTLTVAPVAAWSPLSLPGLQGWWDASDTASIVASAGNVSQWNDKSGHAYHLVQATGTVQPDTGGTLNGLNTLGFLAGDRLARSAFATISNADCTFYMVVTYPPPDFDQGALWLTNGCMGFQVFYTSVIHLRNDYGTDLIAPSGYYNARHVFTLKSKVGTERRIYVDGTSVATDVGSGAASGTTIQVGESLAMTVGEIIVANVANSDTDHAQCEAYLKAKWGTP